MPSFAARSMGVYPTRYSAAALGLALFTPGSPYTHVSDGDANGVFNALATNFNVTAWSNPFTSGKLGITVNGSTTMGFGTLASIVDRATSDSSSPNTASSYFTFDIGLGSVRSLSLTAWSYRSRSADATSTPTGIRIYGSNDNTAFALLDTQSTAFSAANQWRTYKGLSAPFYRYFKLEQIDPNNSAGSNNFFTIGEVELYGQFVHS